MKQNNFFVQRFFPPSHLASLLLNLTITRCIMQTVSEQQACLRFVTIFLSSAYYSASVWHFRSSHDQPRATRSVFPSPLPFTAPRTLHRALNTEVGQIEGCLGETALIPRIPLSKKKHSEPLVPARATFHPFCCSHPF